jgi:hypothetical protein
LALIINDRSADRIELRDQITQLLIEIPLSLNEFLNPEDKTIVDKDEDIFTPVVDHYAVVNPGNEKKSSDEEEVKKVNTAKALRA